MKNPPQGLGQGVTAMCFSVDMRDKEGYRDCGRVSDDTKKKPEMVNASEGLKTNQVLSKQLARS